MSRRATLPQPTSELERAAYTMMKQEGLPLPQTQVRFMAGRRFRADFCWPAPARVILEVQGGTWNQGGHVRGRGYESDCVKSNLAQLEGYLYLQATTDQIHSGEFIGWVRRALELRS